MYISINMIFHSYKFVDANKNRTEWLLLFWKKVHDCYVDHKGGSCGTSCLCMTLTVPVIYPGWHFVVVFITFTGCTCLLFYQQNAVRVWAVSRSYDRREPSVFHHSWDWTEPPGRHWDRKENDKNGKGNVKKQTRIGLSLGIFTHRQSNTRTHTIYRLFPELHS